MTALRRAAVTIAQSAKTSDISCAHPPRDVRLSTPYRPFPPPNQHRHSPGRCCLRPTGSCDLPGQAQLHPCRVRPPLTRGATPDPNVKPRLAIREQRSHSFHDTLICSRSPTQNVMISDGCSAARAAPAAAPTTETPKYSTTTRPTASKHSSSSTHGLIRAAGSDAILTLSSNSSPCDERRSIGGAGGPTTPVDDDGDELNTNPPTPFQ